MNQFRDKQVTAKTMVKFNDYAFIEMVSISLEIFLSISTLMCKNPSIQMTRFGIPGFSIEIFLVFMRHIQVFGFEYQDFGTT